MKSVMISIQPKWCELIGNGNKTIDVRKTKPKIETPFKCYIYCTKAKDYFSIGNGVYACSDELYKLPTGGIKLGDGFELMTFGDRQYDENNFLNGKVIGKFVCDKIYTIFYHSDLRFSKDCVLNDNVKNILKKSSLSLDKLIEYANNKEYIYGWHISDLKIYDKPKELSEFYVIDKGSVKRCEYRQRAGQPEYKTCNGGWIKGTWICTKDSDYTTWCENCITRNIKRPPKSWCYVEELE